MNKRNAFGKKCALTILLIIIIGNIFLTSSLAVSFVKGESTIMTVSFLDVGQGDAIFIETPSRIQVLIDAGPNISVLRELGDVMPFYDRSIDLILATHPDTDHIGGFPEILRRYEVGAVVESGSHTDTALYKEWQRAVEEEESVQLRAKRGQVIHLDENIELQILFPDRDMTRSQANESSIIARLVYGETEILLTGDAPQSVERYLLSLNPSMLEADILKVGHHGSKTSTSAKFLESVTPEVSIIQAGKDNRYGHPHNEVLGALTTIGSEIMGTYERERIVIRSDGRRILID